MTSVFGHFYRLLTYGSQLNFDAVEPDRGWSFKNHIAAADLDLNMPALSQYLLLPHSATWLAGYARVTAVADRSGHRRIVSQPRSTLNT